MFFDQHRSIFFCDVHGSSQGITLRLQLVLAFQTKGKQTMTSTASPKNKNTEAAKFVSAAARWSVQLNTTSVMFQVMKVSSFVAVVRCNAKSTTVGQLLSYAYDLVQQASDVTHVPDIHRMEINICCRQPVPKASWIINGTAVHFQDFLAPSKDFNKKGHLDSCDSCNSERTIPVLPFAYTNNQAIVIHCINKNSCMQTTVLSEITDCINVLPKLAHQTVGQTIMFTKKHKLFYSSIKVTSDSKILLDKSTQPLDYFNQDGIAYCPTCDIWLP